MNNHAENSWRAIKPARLRKTFFGLLDIYSPSGNEEDSLLYLDDTSPKPVSP